MPKTKQPEMVGSATAAERLDIDRSTLNRWVKSGKITPALTGSGKTGEMFFDVNDVEALLKTPKDNGARGGDAA